MQIRKFSQERMKTPLKIALTKNAGWHNNSSLNFLQNIE